MEATTKEEALQNLYDAKDVPIKLMWQTVYFWHLRNEHPHLQDKNKT